ncbi:MAG TPA: Slp family lipoprotein [Nitrospira sp.]|nr:Slp family lipoprotein [Nitrospira sp.]
MKQAFATLILGICVGLAACSAPQLFPSEVTQGVDPNFDFSRWRIVPNQALERKIQLGGRIVQAERQDATVTIVATQLPIVEHPAYGPKDTGKRSGEFAIMFQGPIESPFLQRGNRVIVVGTTSHAKVVSVDDLPRSLPTVTATCLHIWNTGGRDIADFPSYGAGYETLEEETFCASAQ